MEPEADDREEHARRREVELERMDGRGVGGVWREESRAHLECVAVRAWRERDAPRQRTRRPEAAALQVAACAGDGDSEPERRNDGVGELRRPHAGPAYDQRER